MRYVLVAGFSRLRSVVERGVTADFASLPGFNLTPEIERAFEADGIQTPSEPQRLAFQPVAEGKHVVINAATGTGKTLAYLLPLLSRLQQNPAERVVCLAPAAELAVQTLRVAERYKPADLECAAVVSGGNLKKQQDRLTKSTRLIVGTVGRVLELTMARKLRGVTTFVLDEPEPILSNQDAALLLEVLSRPPRPQIVVAGATFGQKSAHLIDTLMSEKLVRADAEDNPLKTRIHHALIGVRDAGDRDLQLERLLERENATRAVVYVNQSHLIRHVYRLLIDAKFRVASLSQERSKEQCKQALREFSAGEVNVLLTTDSAAQGMDVRDVEIVVHYELPRSEQAYVHRAGRTGRAGKEGRSILLVANEDRGLVKRLEKGLGLSFEARRA
jgi:superfamily II DNA/RNA helicase